MHRARTAAPLPPISARHASPGPPAPLQHFDRRFDADSRRQSQPAGGYGESPGKELDAVSSFLDERGAHMRSTEQLAMLQRLRLDGPATDSVEALDEFLAGFVNEGNSSAPLYSSARLPSRAPPTSCMHASTHPYSTHANAHRDALPFFIQTAQARV